VGNYYLRLTATVVTTDEFGKEGGNDFWKQMKDGSTAFE